MAGVDTCENLHTITEVVELSNEPSLENPTWDFLYDNFTKADLQKHCRRLGLANIWITKDKLVDKIMNDHYSLRRRKSGNGLNDGDDGNNAMYSLEKIRVDLMDLKDVAL